MRYYSSPNLKAWNRVSRIGIVVVLLFLACVLFTACDCNGVNNCNGSGTTGTSTGGNPTIPVVQIQYKNLGTWNYWHADGPYPQPPANGAIVAYGDIQNDASCNMKIFYSGDTVANLGHGTFRLVQLTGGDANTILQYVKDSIQPSLKAAYTSCPII